jgi:hypothetical protein
MTKLTLRRQKLPPSLKMALISERLLAMIHYRLHVIPLQTSDWEALQFMNQLRSRNNTVGHMLLSIAVVEASLLKEFIRFVI